ncbi:hypothetical protein Afil01_67210 [Actinorhabdospora filicis]|uniref:LapA family protein n=1 Tax=Actinorhabdospora filicis TaxID=1785913 RepID=A0A9W6SS65_9ACTN|nr:LapA family protein [Actinorhabdospora filicis]GLZ81914.1 hypothetical protein Afil01_67210 [Actinorhabdospora filicis]
MSDQQAGGKTPGKFRITPKMVLGAIIIVLAVWFVLANRDSARVQLFVTSVGAPLWLVLLVTFLAGWLTGWLLRRRKQD